jgi:hypothetical protein
MHTLWCRGESKIRWRRNVVNMQNLVKRQRPRKAELTIDSLFYVPAQRAFTLHPGWPKPFAGYSAGDPFVVRQFSERLRQIMEGKEFTRNGRVFPPKYRRRHVYQGLLNKTIFGDFRLRIEKRLSQKRLTLDEHGGNGGFPFMAWSTGQQEFVPLLPACYWLISPLDIRWAKWVVIEEPEMGLHTQAIGTVLLMILGLLEFGYKVCISTHSPYVLDVVWALRTIKEHKAPIDLVGEIFDAPKDPRMHEVGESILTKSTKVYYFDRDNGQTKDISDLDPGADDRVEAGWGGLSEFSGRVADVVAKAVARGE